jgi:hypothetical protein
VEGERAAACGSESTKSTIVDLLGDAEVVKKGKVRNGEVLAAKKRMISSVEYSTIST